jgi:hypothetical protein
MTLKFNVSLHATEVVLKASLPYSSNQSNLFFLCGFAALRENFTRKAAKPQIKKLI